MYKTISVSKKNIKEGRRKKPYACPIALACKDAGLYDPSVGDYYMVLTGKIVDTPNTVHRFIQNFDAGKPVKPFKFRINLK